MFQRVIAIRKGEIVERDGFWFCDVIPEVAVSASGDGSPR
jgi:hypothetical protein